MSRTRASELGHQAERLAQDLLEERGYRVTNLNDLRANHPTVDLRVEGATGTFECSVKADRSQWQVRLGRGIARLPDDAWLIAFIPAVHRQEIRLDPGGYRVLIVPGTVAREDGQLVHEAYLRERPGASGSFNPAVKFRGQTQVNRDTFARWLAEYEARWDLLPPPFG